MGQGGRAYGLRAGEGVRALVDGGGGDVGGGRGRCNWAGEICLTLRWVDGEEEPEVGVRLDETDPPPP